MTICPPEAGLKLKVFRISRNTCQRRKKEELSKRKRQGKKGRGTQKHPNNNTRRNISQKDISKKTKTSRKSLREENEKEEINPSWSIWTHMQTQPAESTWLPGSKPQGLSLHLFIFSWKQNRLQFRLGWHWSFLLCYYNSIIHCKVTSPSNKSSVSKGEFLLHPIQKSGFKE